MAGNICAFNSATALRRVFMPFKLGASGLHVTRIFVPSLVATTPQQQIRAASSSYWSSGPPKTFGNNTTRTAPLPSSYHNSVDRLTRSLPPNGANPRKFERGEVENRNMNKPGPRVKTKLARLPRDAEIMEPHVRVLSEQEDDGESQPSEIRRVKEVLAELDLKTQSLQVTFMPEPGTGGLPICRIVNKKEEFLKQKLEKEQEKKQKAASKEKQMELNWALAPHDLEHKMKQMQKFLAKGYRVQVLLLKKRGAKVLAKAKEANALIDKIVEATAEVPGSKEWKSREGNLLATMKIFLQGKAQETTEQAVQERGSKKSKKMLQSSEADAEVSSA